jgi:hypothetical protein
MNGTDPKIKATAILSVGSSDVGLPLNPFQARVLTRPLTLCYNPNISPLSRTPPDPRPMLLLQETRP